MLDPEEYYIVYKEIERQETVATNLVGMLRLGRGGQQMGPTGEQMAGIGQVELEDVMEEGGAVAGGGEDVEEVLAAAAVLLREVDLEQRPGL